MTRRAVDLPHIAQETTMIGWNLRRQRHEVFLVEVADHADSIPSRAPLRRALVPSRERAAIVAVRAVHPERFREVHHEAVGPLRLLDRGAMPFRQRGLRDHPDLRVST